MVIVRSALIEVLGGGTPKTSIEEYWNGNIYWLSVKDFVGNTKYVYDTEKKISEKGLKNSSTRLLEKDDIVISARGTVGELAMIPYPMAFNQSCYGLRGIKNIIEQSFLYYLLLDSIKIIKQNTHGAVFDTITKETFNRIEINLPPLDEQKRIADVLSALDDKIEINNKINENLEAQAQAIFKQWFVDEAEKGWHEVELGGVVETSSGGTPSRSKIEYYDKGSINWVKSKELNSSFIIDTEEKITEEALNKSSAKLLPEYSVLIAMYGATVGEFAIITKKMACNQAICALKPNEKYPYTFLYMLIKNKKAELINMAVGSAQQNISQLLVKQIKVLDCIGKINEYHQLVKSLFENIINNKKENQNLSEIRDSLLPKLMNGEVRV